MTCGNTGCRATDEGEGAILDREDRGVAARKRIINVRVNREYIALPPAGPIRELVGEMADDFQYSS